ncbi:MAG TPA: AI-2E family transporter [Acidobacteriaceae bacterium]
MSQEPSPSIRAGRSNIVFAVSLVLGLYLVWLTREVLLLLYVSALFAVVLMPLLKWIMQLRVGKWQAGRGVAILLLLLCTGGLLTLFFMFALPPVIRDMQEFIQELPTRGPQLLGRLQRLPLARHLDLGGINQKLQDFASSSAGLVFESVRNGAGKLASILTAVILTVYFVLEGESAYFFVLSFLEEQPRVRLARTLVKAEIRMGKWLLGQGSLMLILGVLSTIVFASLNIRYAYALGVLMGLFNIIPVAGAFISMSLVILVAAIDSWGRVLGVVIFYAIYVQVENAYLTPRIMKSSVDLSGLAVIVSLLLGTALAGVAGALVSVPTAVLVAVLLDEYLVKRPPVVLASSGDAATLINLHTGD